MIRVAMADDDVHFRTAVVEVLESDGRFEVVGLGASAPEIVDIVVRESPDMVVIDVRMPGGGASAARAISSLRPLAGQQPPVIVALSAEAAVTTVMAMVRAGAVGYLLKGQLGCSLPNALDRCARGESVLATPVGGEALRRLTVQR